MEIVKNKDNYVYLYPFKREHDYAIYMAVEIAGNGFHGAYDEVGMEITELRRFVDELVLFKEGQLAEVILTSISPDEFILRFRDKASLIATLTHYMYGVEFEHVVSLGFDISSLSLSVIHRDFSELFQFQ